MARRPLIGFLFLLVAVVTIGCGSPWGPLAVYRGPSMKARMTGTLVIAQRCAFLETDRTRYLIALREDNALWRWDRDSLEIVAPQGDRTLRFGSGDPITLGGGGFSAREGGEGSVAEQLAQIDWIVPPSPECVLAQVWMASGEISSP